MVMKDSLKAAFFAAGLILIQFINSILTPLLYDSLNPTSSPWIPASVNASHFVTMSPSQEAWKRIDPIYCLTVCMGFDAVVLGVALLVVKARHPLLITEREKDFPKRYFVMVGVFQALSGVMFQYSAPGGRTPPYLQVILLQSSIPIIFILRYVKLVECIIYTLYV